MEDKINQSDIVGVRDLKQDSESAFARLKESEQEKIKMYCALVCSKDPVSDKQLEMINSSPDLEVKQRTPLRVLHRRTLLIRDKWIHKMLIKRINCNTFVFFMLGSAGTYIKEFIHGDLGRTVPNLGSLLDTECDIYQLDVIKLYEKLDDNAKADFEVEAKKLYE